MKRLAIIALSMATALTSALPAEAFPTIAAPDIEALQAQPVDYHGGYHGGYYHHHGGDGWGWALGGLATGMIIGGALAQPRYYGGYYDSGYYDRNYYDSGYYDSGYYEFGYNAPRYYAPRYYAPRYYYRPAYYGGSSHVRWCLARYRSYRAYDDTFQPYYGPRQACVSPYY